MIENPLNSFLSPRPIVRPERAHQSRDRVCGTRERLRNAIVTQTAPRSGLRVNEYDHHVTSMIANGVGRVWVQHNDRAGEGPS